MPDWNHSLKSFIRKFPLGPLLVDLVEHIRHPQEQWEIWQDYWKTLDESKFIRDNAWVEDSSKTVLVASMSTSVYQIKLEAMLALGLKMDGWRVVILTSRVYPWAKRYFRALGFNHFFWWEDTDLTPAENESCQKATQDFLGQELTLPAIKQWSYRKAKVGHQVLSVVCRRLYQGAPDLQDDQVRQQIQAVLPAVLAAVHRAESLFEQLQPQMMYLIEANYFNGPIVDVAIAKGINVIQTVQPSRDDALILKRLTPETRRYHPNSLTLSNFRQYAALDWTKQQEQELAAEFHDRYSGKWFIQSQNQPGALPKTREQIIRELELDPDKKVAVVFSHVLWDANLFYGDDLFADYGDWFIQTVQAACQNSHVNWLIKLHPANLWKRNEGNATGELSEVTLIQEKIGALPNHVKFLYPDSDISTFSLFQLANYGITVRGTVGMELPCFGVLTFTAGTGRYSGLGFTIDSHSKEEYLQKMATIHEYPSMAEEQILLAKKHAYAVFRLRPWTMKSFKSAFRNCKNHPLKRNLLFQVSSLKEIHKNQDLTDWTNWAKRTDNPDYLHPDYTININS